MLIYMDKMWGGGGGGGGGKERKIQHERHMIIQQISSKKYTG